MMSAVEALGTGDDGRRPGRLALAVGVLVFVALVSIGEALVRRDAAGTRRTLTARVEGEVATIRANLEAELNRTLFLAVGLVGYAEALPDLGTEDQVRTVLAAVTAQGDHIRNVGLAPDNQIAYVQPIERNEAAIGLRYEDVPAQYLSVLRAMTTRGTVLDGPVDLVQGGRGLVSRTPVYLADGSYWGLVSLVVDIDSLVAGVEQRVAGAPVRWSLRSLPEFGRTRPIRGDETLFASADIVQEVTIPEGRWELAAVGIGPLAPSDARSTGFRLGAVVVAAGFAALAVVLLRDRDANRRQARQDPLTQLANRRELEERLEALVESARRHDDRFSLVFVDLDGFKEVNDRLGHTAGDAVLTEVGDRLSDNVRSTDLVARVGGDEFIVLLPGIADGDAARAAVAKIVAALSSPHGTGDDRFDVGASIGVGWFPEHGRDAAGLIAAVDEAMYIAKRAEGRLVRVHEAGSPTSEHAPPR